MIYCPKCRSRLYNSDLPYIEVTGVCCSCVQWDSTPDKRYRAAWDAANTAPKARKGHDYVIFKYEANGKSYLTDKGSTTLDAQAKRFTLKQAQGNCLKWNKECGTRYWFYMKVEDTA